MRQAYLKFKSCEGSLGRPARICTECPLEELRSRLKFVELPNAHVISEMKLIAVFFFMLLSFGINAQVFSGNYCIGDLSLLGFTECIEFEQGNLFSYKYNCDDCGRIAGSGNYSIVNDTLKLHFTSNCLIEKAEPVAKNDDDSLFFCFRVKSPDTLELNNNFLSVGIYDKTNQLVTILPSDAKHYYHFGIKKEQLKELKLHIHCFNYNEEWISLQALPSSFDISLVKGENTVPADEEFIFKVDFIGKYKLGLIPVKTRFISSGTKVTGKQKPIIYYR